MVTYLRACYLEFRWAPAVYRLAHILLGADDDCEDDEDDGRVQVVQSVYPIIVVAAFQSGVRGEAP